MFTRETDLNVFYCYMYMSYISYVYSSNTFTLIVN